MGEIKNFDYIEIKLEINWVKNTTPTTPPRFKKSIRLYNAYTGSVIRGKQSGRP